eukprot:Gb_17654 [translate_table: standard]
MRFRKEAMAKAACLSLKVLMLVIFSGWVSLWIIKPTRFWTKLWYHVERKTSTPAFGYSGPVILLFSFPVILLAILGALYLHARGSQEINQTKKKARVDPWTYPILVRGPLGIVSAAELFALIMFLGLLGWTSYKYISNDFSRITAKKLLKSGNLHIWQYKLERIGVRLGFVGTLCLALLFLPVSRGLVLLQLIGIHFEISVKYHVWIANIMMVIYTLHGLCFAIVWGSQNHLKSELSRWDPTGRANLAGEITLLSGLIIWLTSINQIRRKFFELFYYSHHLYVIFIVFFIMHVDDRHFCTVLSGIFLLLLDRFLRFLQSRITVNILSARILPCKAIELTLSKCPGLKYSSTSMILLKIPFISHLQWHPFTITSSSNVDEDRLSVLIKCQGGWTEKLHNFVIDSHLLKTSAVSLTAAVEGPYGPTSNYFLRYDTLILIGGGSGVTPFLSILQEIISQKINKSFTPKVLLIFVVKNSNDLSMLSLISPSFICHSGYIEEGFLKVRAFVTQEEAPKDDCLTPSLRQMLSTEPQTVHFVTKGSTIPALLGTESNLWRASLMGTTFIACLILLGVLNSLCVYPKDHNSYKIYPSRGRGLFMILALSLGIVTTVCIMAIWKWKTCQKHPANGNRSTIQMNAEMTDLHFPEGQLSADPLNLLQPENVHYGMRPNFQDIFSKYAKEMSDSNVGVLVCGPQGMQETIASICRYHCSQRLFESSVAFNFHSINFSF